MFERYTERARRAIFFARYEASQFGSRTIETEHLLLGLFREDKNLTNRFLRNAESIQSIRLEIKDRTTVHERVSTSVDIPLSNECKRILAYAAEEAAALTHRHIGTEHLLLGILREENCLAAEILLGRGLRLNAIREELARSVVDRQPRMDAIPKDAMVPAAITAKLIAQAIWAPIYGVETEAIQDSLQANPKLGVWEVTAGPLYASIRIIDGKVTAMGRNTEGADGMTEPARRVFFFARYEASQFGSPTIETEHFLLALIREERELPPQLFQGATSTEEIRRRIAVSLAVREKTSTSIDLPLSDECKRIFAHAARESLELGQLHIEVGHLLLGILREETCAAAKILIGLGLDLKGVREEVERLPAPVESPRQQSPIPATPLPPAGVVPDLETAKRIAEAVWLPRVSAITGDHVTAQNAVMMHGVWIVTGTHTTSNIETNLAAFIQKEDGKILRIHQDKLNKTEAPS